MDLLKLMEKLKEDVGAINPAVALRVDMALDFLDKLLAEARAEERARISFQLGLVAGEGYKGWKDLEGECETILLEAQTSDEVRDRLIDLVAESKSFSFSDRSAIPNGA
jgi:hypothetical protein